LEKVDNIGSDFLRIVKDVVSDMKLKRKLCLQSFVKERQRWKKQFIQPRTITWDKVKPEPVQDEKII